MIEIFIADSSYLICEGLKNIVAENKDFTIVGEARCGEELSKKIIQSQPDVLIVDYANPLFTLDNIGTVLNFLPNTNILAITSEQPKDNILKALDAGIISYLLVGCDKDEITDAIYATAKGEKFFCGKVLDVLVNKNFNKQDELSAPLFKYVEVSCDPEKITNREIDIIKLIAQGNTNKQIADQLFLSTHTVNTHRKNIMSKLGVNNTAGIVMYAVKENIVSPDKFLFSIPN